MFDYFRVPGVSTIHESKLVAWALFMGERNRIVSSPDRSVRPHRGMLSDIDLSHAVPAPRRPGLFARLLRLFAGRRRNEAASAGATESGTDDRALGEAERKAYVWVPEWESDAASRAHRSA